MEKESKDILFVEVMDPEGVRRGILESLKDIVENLQRFEKFKEIRKDKIENINKLSKVVKDINKLVSDLKDSLPETKIMAVASKKPEEKKKHIVRKKSAGESGTKPLTELQKLEAELSEIESKLGSLR